MMRKFECIAPGSTSVAMTTVYPEQEALFCAAFVVETLDSLFDITPATEAIRVIDSAIARFNNAPESLRPYLDESDWRGLRGNRDLLAKMRAFLANTNGTVSGVFEEDLTAP